MVSTGMRPAPGSSALGTQINGGSTAVDRPADSGDLIPRPTATEFRRLVAGSQENIMHAMGILPQAFDVFKRLLRNRALILLNPERFLYEQNPDAWAAYLDWARGDCELAPLVSKYVDAWPVELYIEHYLSKRTYSRRCHFRKKMKYRLALNPVRVKTPRSEPPEHDPGLLAPPAYEDHYFESPGAMTRDDDKIVEQFLESVNPDLRHLLAAFEDLGITKEADLAVVRSWPPAVRKDFFERELIGKMSALEIQALNVRLAEL